MKRSHWWVYLGIFVLFFAGDRLAGYLLHQETMKSQFRYSRLYSRLTEADVLLLGNSRGLMYYQPYLEEITGLRTCNLSYNGLPMDAAKCLTLDFLDIKNFDPRTPKPLFLLDITLCDRQNDELLAGFLPYIWRSKHLDTLIQHKIPKVWAGAQVSWLFRYNNEIFQRALYYRHRSDEDWLLDRKISPELAAQVAEQQYDLEIHPYLIQQLQETVTAAQASNMRVKLLIGPYFPGFRVNNLQALKAAVEKATGLPVLDYSQALNDPSAFGDYMHPNQKGSRQYLDRLKADGVLE